MKVLVAQIDARRHYAVPRALHSVGSLERLETTLCAHHPLLRLAGCLPGWMRTTALRRLLDRRVAGIPPSLIASSLAIELQNLPLKRARKPAERYRSYVQRNANFGRHVVRRGFGEAEAVYAFHGAAVEVFREARTAGLRCVLDQSLVPVRWLESLLAEERQRFPGWDVDTTTTADWAPLAERELEEWQLADAIICGSPFVVAAVQQCGGPVEKCRVVPYDPPRLSLPDRPPVDDEHRRLRVLFAGTVCLRKGIQYLWQAASTLRSGQIEIRAVGPIEVSPLAVRALSAGMELAGPCPRSEMAGHYAWADVLVLPTLAEGSANVTYEALAAGVPVMTTENAGSIVRDNHDGWLVPARDAAALAATLSRVAADRQLLRHAARNTQKSAGRGNGSYGTRLLQAMVSTGQRTTTHPALAPR